MSKFMNYVKKFLTLSFMSTVAAFGLSFNHVSSMSFDTVDTVLRTQGSSEEAIYSSEDSSEDTPPDESHKSDEQGHKKRHHGPSRRKSGRGQRRRDAESEKVSPTGLSAIDVLAMGMRAYGTNEEGKPDTPKESPGNVYEYDQEKMTAIWTGNDSFGVSDVYVPAKTENYDVVGAILGKSLSGIKSISLDTRNYDVSKGEHGCVMPKLEVFDADNLPNLKKIGIKFEIPDDESFEPFKDDETKATMVYLAMETLRKSDLQKLLEKNSDNMQSDWWLKTDRGGRDITITGESNLSSESLWNYIGAGGIEMDWCEGGYELRSIPNQPVVVIPAAGIGLTGHLWKLEKMNLPNNIQTDRIETIKITNIQDEDQKQKIIKYAGMVLPGFNNGQNDLIDWELTDDDFEENGCLTFTKIYRNADSILRNLVFECGNVLNNTSMSEEEKLAKLVEIKAENVGKMSDDDQKALAVLLDPIDELIKCQYMDSIMDENFNKALTYFVNQHSSMSDEELYQKIEGFLKKDYDKLNEQHKNATDATLAIVQLLLGYDTESRGESYPVLFDGSTSNVNDLEGNIASEYATGILYKNLCETFTYLTNYFSSVPYSELCPHCTTLLMNGYDKMDPKEKKIANYAINLFERLLDYNSGGISESYSESIDESSSINVYDLEDKIASEYAAGIFYKNFGKALSYFTDHYYSMPHEELGLKIEELLKNNYDKMKPEDQERAISAITSFEKLLEYDTEDISESYPESIDESDLEKSSDYLNSISDSKQTTNDLSRPEDQNATNTSSTSNSGNGSTSGNSTSSSSTSNSSSSSSSGSSGTSNTVGATAPTSGTSKLEAVLNEFDNWLKNGGSKKTEKEQYTYLKTLLTDAMSSFSDEEKQKAKSMIDMIEDAIEAADQPSTTPSATPTYSGTSSTGATKTSSSSASTKTSDSSVSPELLSLILSGSLAGLGISLKKRHE